MASVIVKPTLPLRLVLGISGAILALLAALIDLNLVHLHTWLQSPQAGLDFTLLIYLLALVALAGGFFLLRWLRRFFFVVPADDFVVPTGGQAEEARPPSHYRGQGLTPGWLVSLFCLLLIVLFGLSLVAMGSVTEFYYLLPILAEIPFIGFLAGFCFLPAFVAPGAFPANLAGRLFALLAFQKNSDAPRNQQGFPPYRPLLAMTGAALAILLAQFVLGGYLTFAQNYSQGTLAELSLAGEIIQGLAFFTLFGWFYIFVPLLAGTAWATHALLYTQQARLKTQNTSAGSDLVSGPGSQDLSFLTPPPLSRPALDLQGIALWEKLLAGVYTATIAVFTAWLIKSDLPSLPFIVGGMSAGYLILPRFFSRNRWQYFRAFFGGALTTVASAGITAFLLFTLVEKFAPEDLAFLIPMALIGMVISLPFSLIGGLAAVLLDWLLFRRRQKNPVFDTTAFE
ncbi:hypothetical protein O4H49_03250 [Kiloniella laminariae]|uniref:Uncharacterized protein n=1 Tax=Kiloniella laminariae TaxID=454162 RepID=A0ABT4LFR6_9PROT|nr:hypothetical protein [Kiloniella laminariae]MCZ4279780.1 hypothetical protein [Kiloniella laminariae]